MQNTLFKSALTASLLFLSTAPSWANCPNTSILCTDGTKMSVNTKWSWESARCEPMKSGGGESLDKAIKGCAAHNGIIEGSLKDGISLKLIAERAAKIGFIVGKAVYDVAVKNSGSSQSNTPISPSTPPKPPAAAPSA